MYIKPKIKDMYGVLFLDKLIRVGTGLDYAIEIDNAGGEYTDLFILLKKGVRFKKIVEQCTLLSEEEVYESIEMLNNMGYIYDVGIEESTILTDEEKERYKVNINYFSTFTEQGYSLYSIQEKIKNANILIFGVGGIGSNICLALSELGIGKITAVDYDDVELSNLNRQVLYDVNSIGKVKIDEAEKRLKLFNPNVNFVGINKKISSSKDVDELIKRDNYDMVINVADYPTGFIDYWVNEACVKNNIPVLAALVDKKYGRVYSVVPYKTACFQCQYIDEVKHNPEYKQELMAVRNATGNSTSYYRAPNGALGPTCLFQGYFVSYEILRYLLWGEESMLTFNKRFNINFLDFSQEFDELVKCKECPVCGKECLE
ncbi:TPA: ThiF family adenylyltransferase [Enterococcus faecalis]